MAQTASRLAALLAPLRRYLAGPGRCRAQVLREGRDLASFALELADSPLRRARGLMGRAALEGDGMLFVYPWPRTARIWMAGTHIPLDVLFVDRAGSIVKIAPELAPLDRKAVSSGQPVKWVIEIAAGRAAALGLAVGDRVRIETR